MGVGGGSAEGKTNTASTTVQTGSGLSTSSPWAQLQPFLMDVYNQAGSMYHSGIGQGYFPGSTVVPFSPETLEGQKYLTDFARKGVPGMVSAQGELIKAIEDPTAQKFTGGVADWASKPVTEGVDTLRGIADFSSFNPYVNQQFEHGSDLIKNKMASLFNESGMYGTAAHQDVLGRNMNRLFTDIAAPAYEAERGRQLAAIKGLQDVEQGNIERGLMGSKTASELTMANAANKAGLTGALGSLFDLGQKPGQILGDVGASREELAANYLQDTIDRFNAERDAPWQSLSNYIGALTGVPYGTTSAATGSGIARTVGESQSETSMGK